MVQTFDIASNSISPFPFSSNKDAKEQLAPLSAALEKLQQEKQELVDRKRQRQEEGQEKVLIQSLVLYEKLPKIK